MIKIIYTAVFGAIFLLAASCGKFDRLDDGGYTRVEFYHGQRNLGGPSFQTSATLVGGIVIYAYSSNFVTNLKLSSEDDFSANITLPNGSYSFYAVGFTNASTTFAAPLKCGVVGDANPIVLGGGSQTIAINLDTASCANGSFINGDAASYIEGGTSASGTSIKFNAIEIAHCGSGASTAISGFSGTSSNCNTNTAYHWGGNTSFFSLGYKVVAPIYRYEQGSYFRMGSGVVSPCSNSMSAGDFYSTPGGNRWPVGNSAKPGLFPLEIETYSDTSCSTLSSVHYFNNGLIFGPSSQSGRMLPYTSGSMGTTKIFIVGP